MKLDPNATAFVFPGQGSQAEGMGRDLAIQYPEARRTFEEADSILGLPFSRIMWEGPETELNDTLNTQPALFVHSLASYRVFSALYPDFKPIALAGHSLGELSALAASGSLSFQDGLRLVRTRGQLMKRAGDLRPGKMAAILNLDIPTLERVCAQASTESEPVQVANDNCPGQVVISGARTAVERAMEGAKAAGAKRAIPLAVSIAAHSSLMSSIQAEWDEAVSRAALNAAAVTVIGNVGAGNLRSADELRVDIRAQMQSRVRWTESVRNMIEGGIKSFVEMGSGTVLIGLVRRIDGGVTGYPLGKPEDFTALA